MRQLFIHHVVSILIFLTRTKEFIVKRWILLTALAAVVIAMFLFNISFTLEVKQAGELLWTIG